MKAIRTFAIATLLVCLGAGFVFADPPADKPAPDMPGSSLWIPWSDFKEILKKIEDAAIDAPDPPPPHDAVIGSAEYDAVVGESSVRLEVTGRILVLKKMV